MDDKLTEAQVAECRNGMSIIIKNETVFIDENDYNLISEYKWYINKDRNGSKTVAAWSPILKKKVRLHRVILGIDNTTSPMVDHINGNALDNRRSNLRTCSNGQNQRNRSTSKVNTSGYKCVFFDSRRNKFYSQICVNRKKIHIGTFNTAEEAHKAYCEKAKELHGEFARF